jgi:hypothetical protein
LAKLTEIRIIVSLIYCTIDLMVRDITEPKLCAPVMRWRCGVSLVSERDDDNPEADPSYDGSGKFTWSAGDVAMTQCVYCRHLVTGAFGAGCRAFPGGIPQEIVANDFDHRRPHPDEVEPVHFEPRHSLDPISLQTLVMSLDGVP